MLGVLAGMAAGAALGLLFAPEKGKKLRRSIVRKGEDFTDSLEEISDTLNEKVDEKFNALIDAISGKVKKARSQSDFVSKIKSELVD